MGDMDQGIKRLIQSHPADVLALALPDAEYIAPLSIEVATEPQLVLDTLLRVRYKGIDCAVDIEAEAQPRADIGHRLADYAARARIVTGLSVIPIVLWLNADGPPPQSPHEEWVADLLLSTRRFFGIEMYRLPAERLIERGLVGLLPLVPFTRDGADAAIVERAALAIKDRTAGEELQVLESLLAVFASRTIGREVARGIIRRLFMSTEILETSPLYQEWVQQGVERGIELGIERGLREAALVLLRARFTDVPPQVAQALSAASAEQIQNMLEHVLSEDLDQLRARLET